MTRFTGIALCALMLSTGTIVAAHAETISRKPVAVQPPAPTQESTEKPAEAEKAQQIKILKDVPPPQGSTGGSQTGPTGTVYSCGTSGCG